MSQNWIMLAIIWFQSLAVTLLIVIFLWRRLWRDLPFFFAYLVYAILVVIFRYLGFYLFPQWYFYLYWISDLTASLVVFLAMYEVFFRRLFPNFHRTRFYRQIFPLAAGAILVIAVTAALQAHDPRAAFKMTSRAFDFVRSAVLIFFIGLMVLMGRAWSRYDLGITLGFAIQASAALANSALKIYLPLRSFGVVESVAYDISCLIWLFTFLTPERPIQVTVSEQFGGDTLNQAHTWERMLKSWLNPRRVRAKH